MNQVTPDTAPTTDPDAHAERLESLLRRLDDKPGFCSLSESITAINEITNSDDQNIDDLSAILSKDFGLTATILRVANSATYRASSGGGVTTVSRAVNVLGFSNLRDIAVTVILFAQMKDRAGAREVKEAFLRAHLAGTLAREAGRLFMPKSAELVYTYALLHSLGRILALLYFPEETQQIQDLINHEGRTEDEAARAVFGVDYAGLGQAVTSRWMFPSSLVNSLKELPEGAISRPKNEDDTLWMLSGFGNEVSASLSNQATTDASGNERTAASELKHLRQRFADVMMLSGPQLHTLVQKSFDDTKAFAGTLGVAVSQSGFIKQVTSWIDAGPEDENKPVKPSPRIDDETTVHTNAASAAETRAKTRDTQHQTLTAGISKLSNAIVGDFKLNDIFRMTLDIMLEAMDFQRVLMCVRDEKSGYMVAQVGCGRDAAMVARKFRFPLKDTPNVFQLAVNNGLDIVIKDIAEAKIADKIPPWYHATVTARTFTLMPLVIKGKTVAMIYGDKQQPNSILIAERELSLLKTLRNQAVLAIKHSLLTD